MKVNLLVHKNLIGANKHSRTYVLWNQSNYVCVLMFPRYFRYSIGWTSWIQRDGRW